MPILLIQSHAKKLFMEIGRYNQIINTQLFGGERGDLDFENNPEHAEIAVTILKNSGGERYGLYIKSLLDDPTKDSPLRSSKAICKALLGPQLKL